MIAIICRTPMHIFRTIQLKLNVLKSKNVDVFVFDTFPNSETIAKRMEKSGFYHAVYYIKEKEAIVDGKLSDVRSCLRKASFQRILHETKYDELFVFNIFGTFTDVAFNILKKNNPKLVYHMVEDGPSVYYIKKVISKTARYLYPIVGLQSAQENIDYWWFSKPELMEPFGNGEKKALPVVDRTDKVFVACINQVFNYRVNPKLVDADIIFMEECYFNDGLMKKSYDLQMFKKIQDKFSNYKCVVKLHPRSVINRFDQDFYVLPMDGIPWEVYTLNYQMDQKILVSISCATMTSSKLMFGDEPRSLMLFPIVENKIIEKSTGKSYFTKERVKKIQDQKQLYDNENQFCIVASKDAAMEKIARWLTEREKSI